VEITEASTSRYARVSTGTVHYNEAGDGSAVICLHGGGPGASGWGSYFRNIGPLSQQYRCILIDIPGYGKSDALSYNGPRVIEDARVVRELMDTMGIEKAAIIGNFLGGLIAQSFAIDYPERLRKLVLIASGVSGKVPVVLTTSAIQPGKLLREVFANPKLGWNPTACLLYRLR
jgi:2,6-dioxo-6-phenylhexa-3-enoate hydrolase